MKITTIIIRILFGALLTFSAVAVLFHLFPKPPLEGAVKIFNDGMEVSYLLTFVKVVELVCGILFIVGRFVPLATVVIFPISINIFLFHAFLDPKNIAIPIFVLAANLFLAYVHRDKYKGIFEAK